MEQIYQEFKEVVGKTDLHERTLEDIVTNLYKEGMTDEEKAEVMTKGKAIASSMQGNLNKLIADKVKEAIARKEKTNTKPEAKDPVETKKDDEITEKVNLLLKEIEESKREKTLEKKKAEILAATKKLGVKDDEFCVEAVNFSHLTVESDVDEMAKKILELYNKRSVETPTPAKAKGGGDKKDWAEKFKKISVTD